MMQATAADLLAAVVSHVEYVASEGETAIAVARIPFALLDEVFATLGAFEDFEDQHDREADYFVADFSSSVRGRTISGFSDDEPSMGWSNPLYDRQLSWSADGGPLAVDHEQ